MGRPYQRPMTVETQASIFGYIGTLYKVLCRVHVSWGLRACQEVLTVAHVELREARERVFGSCM